MCRHQFSIPIDQRDISRPSKIKKDNMPQSVALMCFVAMINCSINYGMDFILQWLQSHHGGVSNHQPHGCLGNRLFRRRSNKTSKLRVTDLCAGNSPGPVNSPYKGPATRKMYPFDDVIMIQNILASTPWVIRLPFHRRCLALYVLGFLLLSPYMAQILPLVLGSTAKIFFYSKYWVLSFSIDVVSTLLISSI